MSLTTVFKAFQSKGTMYCNQTKTHHLLRWYDDHGSPRLSSGDNPYLKTTSEQCAQDSKSGMEIHSNYLEAVPFGYGDTLYLQSYLSDIYSRKQIGYGNTLKYLMAVPFGN